MNKSRKSKYELKKKIGTGSYGKVYKAYNKEEGKTVAIKIVTINKKNIKEIKSALNEVRILSSIKSKYIVEYIEAFVNPSHTQFWIVMEFMGGGDLANKIKYAQKKNIKIPESQIWNYLIQILKGIKDLNCNSIIHRDIKPANIFLSEDFKEIKIGDMNVSKVLKNRLADTAIGTPYYLAPEIWERNSYDEKIDVYSLGCLVYELASLKHPFEARSTSDLHYKVKNKKIPNVPYNYSAELNYIVKKCLVKDPNKRPSAFELIDNNVLKRKVKELGFGGIFENNDNNNYMQMMDTIILPNKLSKLNAKLPNNNNKKIKKHKNEKRCNSVGKFKHIDDIYNELNTEFYSKIVTPKNKSKINFFEKKRYSEKKLNGNNDFEIEKKKVKDEKIKINKWESKDTRSNSKKFMKKKIPVVDFIKKNRKSLSRKSLKNRNSSRSKSKKKNSYVYASQKSNVSKNSFYKRSSVERKVKKKPPTPRKSSKKLIPVNYNSNQRDKRINKNEYNSLKNRNPPSIKSSKRPPIRSSKLLNKKNNYSSFHKKQSMLKNRKSFNKKKSTSRNSSVKSARYQSPRAMRYGEYMKNVAKKQREKAKNFRSVSKNKKKRNLSARVL